MTKEITNELQVIDSRDIVARIDDLEGNENRTEEEARELSLLKEIAEQGEEAIDWQYGETLIREDYFVEYIEELINDCYNMPKELKSGDWPWRHMKVDYAAAAEDAKVDYAEIDFDGVTYLIRI